MDYFYNNVTTDTPDASFFKLPEICVYEQAVNFETKELAQELTELQDDLKELVIKLKEVQKEKAEAEKECFFF